MKNILIIEDDVVFSRSISNWLKKKGMATAHVATLSAARKELQAKEFDLVLADLRLPDGSSMELLPEVISPLDGTTVTVFSMTELLYDQTMADWRTHNGIDVQAEEGAAVKTAADGTVLSVTSDELMGTTVVIQHSSGYTTQYSSLQSDVPVAEGQSVRAGDIIGRVGSTSAAESEMGPHLHFSVSQDGSVIDPHAYIED